MRLCLYVVILCAACCGGHGAVMAFESPSGYVEPQMLPPELLPPPPAEGTPAFRQQINDVLRLQHAASDTEIAAARDEQNMRLDLMTSSMGPDFTREKFPRTFVLLDRVLADASRVTEADKKFWHTRRPYLADAHVKLWVNRIDQSPAYPSGHTSESRVLAEILGMLSPDKLNALRARADAIATHRIEAGVHFPDDIEGGRLLAMLIVGALAANDDFQDDLAIARQEITAR